jgi:hypothetical protein
MVCAIEVKILVIYFKKEIYSFYKTRIYKDADPNVQITPLFMLEFYLKVVLFHMIHIITGGFGLYFGTGAIKYRQDRVTISEWYQLQMEKY